MQIGEQTAESVKQDTLTGYYNHRIYTTMGYM